MGQVFPDSNNSHTINGGVGLSSVHLMSSCNVLEKNVRISTFSRTDFGRDKICVYKLGGGLGFEVVCEKFGPESKRSFKNVKAG